MRKNPKHLKITAEHNTPRAIVDAARTVLGGIDLDPMSNAAAQRIIRATRFYTQADNCFVRDWKGTVLLNPAGGLTKEAWQRLMRAYGSGAVSAFVWIGFSLEQLQTLQRNPKPQESTLYDGPSPIEFPICIPHTRIAFVDLQGVPQTSPTHANYICYGGPDVWAFYQTFSQFGTVSVPQPAPTPESRTTTRAAFVYQLRRLAVIDGPTGDNPRPIWTNITAEHTPLPPVPLRDDESPYAGIPTIP